jgi:hypothetical protein
MASCLMYRWSGRGSESAIGDAFFGTDIQSSQHRPELGCENTSDCLRLLVDSRVEEYNLKDSLTHLHKREWTLCKGYSPS